jgi:hypothetical protein
MASFSSMLIITTLGCCALYATLDWALFKRIIADRFTGRILAGIVTYLASAIIYGFGDFGGDFRIDGFAIFLIPSFIALAAAIKQGRTELSEPAQQALGSS